MTLLGKLLVFVNLVLSFLMLSWAAMLFTNRVDFSNKKATADQAAGQLAERETKVKDGVNAVNLANARWRESLYGNDGKDKRPVHVGLLTWEKRRLDAGVFYAAVLKAADVGPDGKGEQVVIKRVATKDGRILPDPQNPAMPLLEEAQRRKTEGEARGAPLYCIQWYVKELDRLTAEVEKAQKEQQNLAKEEGALTDQIVGPKGVRQRIVDEQIKLDRVTEEAKDVESRQTNSLVETELLVVRRRQLERRIDELKNGAKEKD